MTKNEKNQTAETKEVIIKDIGDLPVIMPDLPPKELFNLLQESSPIADLADKEFKITGLYPEWVEVPKDKDDEESELVQRVRLTLLTDVGVFHSYSVTFGKALVKAISIFGAKWMDQTYKFTVKMRGSGDGAKALYLVRVI